MKMTGLDSPVLASQGLEKLSSVMGMNAEAALRMTQHLCDTIYSNKVLAVVRESLTNSFDEHVKFSIKRPIETGIRTTDSGYEFFARDFAQGLDEKGVRTVFAMYGESKKNHTNDLAGGFGIGTGAFVSYDNQASVVSYHKGEKKVYSLVRGANEEGFLVGHCYLVHTEPTSETGIEVIVPIKTEDIQKFTDEIRKFVSLSPHDIQADILGTIYSPLKELGKVRGDNFTLRVLENGIDHPHSHAYLQMGGVTYGQIPLPEGLKQKKDSFFVIDVNIGQMTVTLSRESFHETPLNTAFKAKISAFLEELAKKDLAAFAELTVDKIVGDALATSDLKKAEGEYFSAHLSNIHKDIWPLIDRLECLNQETNIAKKGNKPILVLMHETNSWSWKNYWLDKARKLAKDNNTNYYFSYAKIWNKLAPEAQAKLEAYFSPVGIKSLPYPKDKSMSVSGVGYACYRSNGRNIGKHTPLSFLNWLIKDMFDQSHIDFKTVDEGKNWLKAQKKLIKSKNSLDRLSFSTSGGRYVDCWQTRSVRFLKEAKDLGFFERGDAEYQKIIQKINTAAELERNKAREINNAQKKFVRFNTRTLNAIAKVKNAKRINNFFDNLLKENTLRKKTLATFDSCHNYYSCDKIILERHELRKILQLQ